MKKKEVIKLLNAFQCDFRERLNQRDIKISKLERTIVFLSKHAPDEIVPGNTTCYFSTNGYFTYILDGFVEESKNFELPGHAGIYADEEEREKRKPIYHVLNQNDETALIKITREEETMYVQLYKLTGEVANVTDTANAFLESIDELAAEVMKGKAKKETK